LCQNVLYKMFNFYIPKIEQNVQLLSEKIELIKAGFMTSKMQNLFNFYHQKLN
jgi:hypothetical protein